MIAFKNAELVTTNAPQTIYVCPITTPATVAIVTLLQAATAQDQPDEVSVWCTDYSNSNFAVFLGKDIQIPASEAQSMLTGKLVLMGGDALRAQSVNSGTVAITFSAVELQGLA